MSRQSHATAPAPREIPPGKVLLAEYGDPDVRENFAVVETLAHAWSERVRATVRLVCSSPGWEMAGSVARWTNGHFAVTWMDGGASYGQRYVPDSNGERGAREHFERLMTNAQGE